MLKSFLGDSSQDTSASIKLQASREPVSGREYVKVIVIGSLKGVKKIIHALYIRGFAEVTEWTQPVPTGNPGEVMRVLRRLVFVD
ncbi:MULTISPECIES: hypothetical protein [unclassified Moorena]|uniref:hypothetical protein n=1 Tax=unclassified Moorena TaxID=2683338 RepID=UPI0013B98E0C|nr:MULTISPECIES: hypothetical protein [unclassified Moorena]NEO89561.1 hypothetical protein [Moorena sp. SIO3G5]NEO20015.1 hypothetical protein [Moorena sp. SIO4A5]NEO41244.1 hypothetical protein [Moorena sp. SIOASIH]NEO79764.1 hypothetical protein [Moorena sp. SIO4G3]NEP23282.1 hypothetical protein [Moorena sp. SIO3I6]